MEDKEIKEENNSSLAQSFATIVAGVLLALLILHFIQPTLVVGCSMEPYLKEGDYLLMNKFVYKHSEPEYGDIVVFPREGKLLIKRVIGKPGDTIEIKDGKVFRDGNEINDYTAAPTYNDMVRTLPENEYFCLGDNRENSMDSRDDEVGNVKLKEIKGKAFVRLFPRPGKI